MSHQRHLAWPMALAAAAALMMPSAGWSGDYFIDSDAYEDGEEVVGRFLGDAEYRLMIEDIERNGVTFDWGWTLTPGWGNEPVVEPDDTGRRRVRDVFKRRPKAGRTVQKPKALGFDIADYSSIYIAPAQNHAGLAGRDMGDAVHANFVMAAEELGLRVVDEAEAADLELGLAIVDLKREGTFVYFATVDPFITLEVRLRTRAGQDLLLLRNRAHSKTPAEASLRFASLLTRFLG